MNLSKFIQLKIFSRLIILYGLSIICFLAISYYGLEKETKRYVNMTSGYITSSTQQLINEGEFWRVQLNISQFSKKINESSDFKICPNVYIDDLLIAKVDCSDYFSKKSSTTMVLNNSKKLKIDLMIDYDNFILSTLFKVFIFSLFSFIALIFIKKSIEHLTNEITKPLRMWSTWAQMQSYNEDLSPPEISNDDLNIDEFKNFNEFTKKAFVLQKDFYTLKISEEKSAALADLAREVSHDIRSPLTALRMSIEDAPSIPNEQREMINSSFQRINDIANNLLNYKHVHQNDDSLDDSLKDEPLAPIVAAIVSEKRLNYREKTNIIIEADLYNSDGLFSLINQTELKRVLSNLINNSIEAMNHEGKIIVQIKDIDSENVRISVIDNGKGIPSSILQKLGEKGFSHGKEHAESGHGLGLSHAKKAIESFAGNLIIESTEGLGTTVHINLKKSLAKNLYEYVYIDDDKALLKGWERRANRKNISLLTLNSCKDFEGHICKIDKELTSIYLDDNFGESQMRGEEFAKILHARGYKKIFMASGRDAKEFSHLSWLTYSGKDCPF